MKEVLKLALDALEKIADWHGSYGPFPEKNSLWRGMAITTSRETVTTIKEALAKQEQGEPDYKTLAIQLQQQRTWVGLTDEEMNDIWSDQKRTGESITRAIEAKLKEKNYRD
jgi:hypothetical protein